jgi:hypothetical protein
MRRHGRITERCELDPGKLMSRDLVEAGQHVHSRISNGRQALKTLLLQRGSEGVSKLKFTCLNRLRRLHESQRIARKHFIDIICTLPNPQNN